MRNTSKKDLKKWNQLEPNQGPMDAAMRWWQNYSQYERSIVDEYWRSMKAEKSVCKNCNVIEWGFSTEIYIPLADPEGSLEQMLRGEKSEENAEARCEYCNKQGKVYKRYVTHFPKLLAINFQRVFALSKKSMAKVHFPLALDMTEFALPSDPLQQRHLGPEWVGAFKYELYAVINHSGLSSDSGHYIAYTKESEDEWLRLSDEVVGKNNKEDADLKRRWYGNMHNETPVMLFYKREDMPLAATEPSKP